MVDIYEIWYGGNAIRGDLDAITFNSTASTILKWLRFKFQNFSLAQKWYGTESQGMYFAKLALN
jgi:hypothetical protein